MNLSLAVLTQLEIIVVGGIIIILAVSVYGLFRKTYTPVSLVKLPKVALPVTIPPGSVASVIPAPFPTTVGSAGLSVSVTVARGPNPIAGIPVSVRIHPGSDNVLSSVLDAGPNPAGGQYVGDGIDGATILNPTGTTDLTFTVRSTITSEEDVLVIIVNPGGRVPGLQEQTFQFSYSTTMP